jgi:hypothetical protein
MTDYADIDDVTRLTVEQQSIDEALNLLDNYAGTVTSCTIAATEITPTTPIAVTVATTDPAQAMISGVRAGLIQRYNAINKELRDLGVTGTPPNHAGGPPTAEPQPA